MQIMVLGAGVVGISAAYYLAKAGHEVTVVDRQPEVARETSFANGGQIAVSHAEPWAGPGTPWKALKWLGKPDAPLLFHPRLDPALWRWLLRFLANCTAERARRNTERTVRIAAYSCAALGELRDGLGLDYHQRSDGILHFYRNPREYEHALAAAAVMRDFGVAIDDVSVADMLALEPALATVKDELVGGTMSPKDESGDAWVFTVALAKHCADLGVTFRLGTSIAGLTHDGTRITGLTTDQGPLQADHYVMCLGSYSPLLLRPLGLNLPVYPAKGYSVTLPLRAPDKAPRISLTDDEHKLVFSRYGDRLRIGGTAEFTGYNTDMNEPRARGIAATTLQLFPGCAEPEDAILWTGLRPSTPDSVPVIGPTRFTNLMLNTGHGTLGWTMACGSGRIVADLLSNRPPDISLEGYGLDRF